MLNSAASIAKMTAPKYKQLRPEQAGLTEQKMPDGTCVNTNAQGQIVFVEYASGIKVKRNNNFTMVSMLDGSYMMGSPSFAWLRLD